MHRQIQKFHKNCWAYRLEALKTLILGDNLLTRIQLTTDDFAVFTQSNDSDWNIFGISKSKLMFPNLSMLDISNNCLKVR